MSSGVEFPVLFMVYLRYDMLMFSWNEYYGLISNTCVVGFSSAHGSCDALLLPSETVVQLYSQRQFYLELWGSRPPQLPRIAFYVRRV